MKSRMTRTWLVLVGLLALTGCARGDLNMALKPYFSGDYEDAQAALMPLAEGGNAEAQYWLGTLYDDGKGDVEEDDTVAARWYRRAANSGLAAAQYQLAELFVPRALGSEDEQQMIDLYKQAAKQGHLMANVRLAQCYGEGLGTPADPVEAYRWAVRAFLHGDAMMLREYLSLMEWNGFEGAHLFENADLSPFETTLAQKNHGVEGIESLAQAGDAQAQFLIGAGQVQTNAPEAIRWLQAAAEQGEPIAQFLLGKLFLAGEVVERDQKLGIRWMSSASTSGLALANQWLADLYAKGEGVSPDDREAIRLYLRAAMLGVEDAERGLERMAQDGSWP